MNAQRRARVYTVRWTPTDEIAPAARSKTECAARAATICVWPPMSDVTAVSWRSVTYINY